MHGKVVALHVLLPVIFSLIGKPDIAIEFVVDTGFSGDLTLPASIVEELGLEFIESTTANLATDDEVELPVYGANVIWDGSIREVRVFALGKRPLLGTDLLNGRELVALFEENGFVSVTTL